MDEILHLQHERHDLEHEIEVHLVCIDEGLILDFDEVLHQGDELQALEYEAPQVFNDEVQPILVMQVVYIFNDEVQILESDEVQNFNHEHDELRVNFFLDKRPEPTHENSTSNHSLPTKPTLCKIEAEHLHFFHKQEKMSFDLLQIEQVQLLLQDLNDFGICDTMALLLDGM